jgi:hypothetical protein
MTYERKPLIVLAELARVAWQLGIMVELEQEGRA